MKTDRELQEEYEALVHPTKDATNDMLKKMRRNPTTIFEDNKRAAEGGRDETP